MPKPQNSTLFKNKCLINNAWIDAKNGDTIDIKNPFDNSLLATIPNLSEQEVETAIKYSKQAQKLWENNFTAEQRGNILHKWADLIDENADELATILTLECGKPIKEAKGEIAYANSFLRWFAEEGKRVYGDIIPAKATNLRYTVLKQPVGVCASITPWNFPTAMLARKVAPALASGCSSLVLPDANTPLSALAFAELGIKAGLPAGVLQVITGDAPRLGKVLCDSQTVAKISFTGSTRVGKILMSQCADTLKRLSLELGGNAPFIIFEDADLDAATDGLIMSKYRNAGQTCVCANRIFVHKNIHNTFVEILTAKVKQLKVGNGINTDTDIGPLINSTALEKVERLQKDALSKGAKCVLGGERNPVSALAYEPTILIGITAEMDIAKEEIFGPITAITTFTDEDEVIAKANDCDVGLAAYFYTESHSRAWRVTEKLEYGMVGHNTGLISNEVAPFGGIKQSGFGREGSKYGIAEYLNIKYWCSAI